MDRWVGKVALVTGASSGIGAAIIRRLVEEGLQVVGVARRVHLIENQSKQLTNAKGKLYPIKADLTKSQDIERLFDWLKEQFGIVHILINNAAILKSGHLIDLTTNNMKDTLNLNILALLITTKETIKLMITNQFNGHIIQINSIAGHNLPNNGERALYGATKYAITALTEGIRQELRELNTKIKITSLSPGLVNTEMVTTNSDLTDTLREFLQKQPMLSADDIADSVVYILATPPHVQVHELTIKPVGELINC